MAYETKEQKAQAAMRALSTSVLPLRDPSVDGLTCNADVPFAIHHELMQAAIDKAISLSWLCAIYRAGVMAREPQPNLSAAAQTLEKLVEKWRGRTGTAEWYECADELSEALSHLRQREDTTP